MNYKVEDMGIKFLGVFPHEETNDEETNDEDTNDEDTVDEDTVDEDTDDEDTDDEDIDDEDTDDYPEEPLSIHRFEFFSSSESTDAVIDFSSYYHAESKSRRLHDVAPFYEREEGFLDSGMSFGDSEFVKESKDDFTEEEKDFYIKVNDMIQWIESHIEDNFDFAERFYFWSNIPAEY